MLMFRQGAWRGCRGCARRFPSPEPPEEAPRVRGCGKPDLSREGASERYGVAASYCSQLFQSHLRSLRITGYRIVSRSLDAVLFPSLLQPRYATACKLLPFNPRSPLRFVVQPLQRKAGSAPRPDPAPPSGTAPGKPGHLGVQSRHATHPPKLTQNTSRPMLAALVHPQGVHVYYHKVLNSSWLCQGAASACSRERRLAVLALLRDPPLAAAGMQSPGFEAAFSAQGC